MQTTFTPREAKPLLQALASNSRLRILESLREREQSVGELSASVGLSQPLLSWHLSILRDAGMVEMCRSGRSTRCRVKGERLRDLGVHVAALGGDNGGTSA